LLDFSFLFRLLVFKPQQPTTSDISSDDEIESDDDTRSEDTEDDMQALLPCFYLDSTYSIRTRKGVDHGDHACGAFTIFRKL
jgi:hypothetical protein